MLFISAQRISAFKKLQQTDDHASEVATTPIKQGRLE